jgi:hypothetical protein
MSAADTEIELPKPLKKRSIWRWLFWILFMALVFALVLSAFIWLNRYSLLEDVAEDLLLEQGIEAELSIDSISKTQAVLKNVRLRDSEADNQEAFFKADKITVDYDWRELREGRVDKLIFTRPQAQLTLDETGQIIDGWLPPKSEGKSGEPVLPPSGIIIEDGTFTLGSPFGAAVAQVDAIFFAQDNFTANLEIAPTQFSYGNWRLAGGGQLDIELKEENPKLDIDVKLSTLEHPVIDASELHIRGDMIPEISGDYLKITGDLDFEFASLVTAQIMAGAGDFKWAGQIERDPAREHILGLSGTWSSTATDVVLPDPARRKTLAETLSLSETLSNAPIAQNFSGELTRTMTSLLERSDIEAAGQIELGSQGLAISLSGPAFMRGDKTTLRMEQTDWTPLYNFSRADEELRLAFHAGLTQPAGLIFREADLVALSQNGWQLGGITRFSADISTSDTWQGKDLEGRGARLALFKAETVYKGGEGARNLMLSGGVDYDGSGPGGYGTGLQTSGRMMMDLNGGAMSVTFKPDNDTPILISKVETATEWRAEDVSAILLSEGPIYTRSGDGSKMSAQLSDVSLATIDSTNTKNLGMTFEAMNLSGELQGESQSWDVLGQGAKILSEDMPGPGTVITTPEARIQVQRETAQSPIQFYMAAPEADAKTQLVNATGIRIEAAGQPDKYVLRYSPGAASEGRVKFAGDAIPRLPMTGVVNYEGGTFAGMATTTLPLADDTPIDIAYRFKDGQGTADVDIPKLRFLPKGLQPQYLVSALKGKIAEVEGLVEAKIKLAFAAGQPLQSSGSAKIIDMNFGTLPGPLTGVNTELQFSNMFPLQNQGRQTLTVDKFDPGFPLENGVIEFEMIPDGVKVYSARWPLGDGFFSLDPFEWLYSNETNRVVMRIENVSIGEFLKDVGDGALTATGDIEGTLPIVMSGVDVRVENGELWVKNGGVIQYKSNQLDSISELDGTNERAVAAMRAGNYRDAAFEALKNFEYQELRVKIDGALDGPIDVFLKADGKNKDVLGGQPFLFNINLQGELLNILRSFNTNAQIKSELARRGLTKEEEIPDLEQ